MSGRNGTNGRRERDQRVRRTRGAIVESFNGIALTRPYEEIHVEDIIGEAGVGRSTFYEHFRNKDELFRHALSHVLSVLAEAVTAAGDTRRITQILEHFWENRQMARGMLRGESAAQVARRHAELIEDRLAGECRRRRATLMIPIRLAGAQLGAAQLGLVQAWLDDPQGCPANKLADELRRTTVGAVQCMFESGVVTGQH